MEQEILRLLTILATKLGTTAEHLWMVLTQQAYVEALVRSTQSVVLVCLCTWLFIWFRKVKFENGDICFFAWLAWIVLAVITTAQCLDTINTVATALYNPEYWALKQLIGSK